MFFSFSDWLFGWPPSSWFLPSFLEEYGIPKEERRNKAIYFFGAAAFIALTSFLAYSPVLEEMQETARTHQLLTLDTQTGSAINLTTSIIKKFSKDPYYGLFRF